MPVKKEKRRLESINVRLHKDTYEELLKLKEHHRETMDDVIKRLIKKVRGNEAR